MESKNTSESQSEWVIIREDSPDLIKDLSGMLSEKGIPSQMTIAPGCSTGSCSCRYILLVPAQFVQKSMADIEEYFMILHPEIREAHQRMEQGKCPACGSDVKPDDKECPDCGLMLIVEI